jgi:dinuclear metal center YbgI/SA1388 family protein
MLIKDVITEIETYAPPVYQESYDNSGLLVGNKDNEVTGVLLSLDCVESVIDEAIRLKCNLIVAHHPIIFGGLKRLTGSNYVERTVIKAIKNNIAIYAAHTNLDNVKNGVNAKIAEKLGLINLKILAPKKQLLKKLVTYVPASHSDKVREAVFEAGAGHIGNYDSCSFNTNGKGTFRGNENSNPFIGEKGKLSFEDEVKVEVIFEAFKEPAILKNLLANHPYEEVAFDVYPLDNTYQNIGSGMTGELEKAMPETEFLERVKKSFHLKVIKHTPLLNREVKKVAFCGGSGSFLIKNAINSGSDVYISADIKYHEYFDADGKILIVDTGHFENEQFTPEIFYDVLRKKFTTFATYLSKINTNPVNYF